MPCRFVFMMLTSVNVISFSSLLLIFAENVVVDCSHQELTSVPDFDPVESFSTWKLIMTGNPLRKIPKGAFKNLTDLAVGMLPVQLPADR